MMEQVSMPALKYILPPEATRPNTTTTPPLSLYPLQALLPSQTTHAVFNYPQFTDLAMPPVI